jgi:hypothetical protein
MASIGQEVPREKSKLTGAATKPGPTESGHIPEQGETSISVPHHGFAAIFDWRGI